MADVDPCLASALTIQLARWRTALDSGARRVGWKLGIGERESIGPGPVIGHLTSATQLDEGAVLGPLDRGPPPTGSVDARLIVNGQVRAESVASPDLGEIVRSVAALLGAIGERLSAGDCLITGAIVQLPVEPGGEVVAALGPLGTAGTRIAL